MNPRTYFNFNNGITIKCYYRRDGQGMAHFGEVFQNGEYIATAKYHYLNRPWECFTYQTVLQRADRDILGGAISQEIDDIENGKRTETGEFLEKFKADYDSLHENTKQHLKNANIELTSIEQAESLMKISKAWDVLLNM